MPVTSGRIPNPLLIEYICSKCGTHLKITDSRINKIDVVEDCPYCGISLSKSLAVKNQNLIEQTRSLSTAANHPKFVLASSYPRLKFGISALDTAITPLVTGDMLCISGPHATSLLEGLCCQSLLPARSGGLESERVVYLDAGNTSQIYRFVRLARFLGLEYKDALRRVVQTRVFTIHQLASVVIKELESTAKSIEPKAIFISDLFELFIREPNTDVAEAERLAVEMALALFRLASSHIVTVSLTRPSDYDRFLFTNSSVKRLDLANVGKTENSCQSYSCGSHKISLQVPDDALLAEV